MSTVTDIAGVAGGLLNTGVGLYDNYQNRKLQQQQNAQTAAAKRAYGQQVGDILNQAEGTVNQNTEDYYNGLDTVNNAYSDELKSLKERLNNNNLNYTAQTDPSAYRDSTYAAQVDAQSRLAQANNLAKGATGSDALNAAIRNQLQTTSALDDKAYSRMQDANSTALDIAKTNLAQENSAISALANLANSGNQLQKEKLQKYQDKAQNANNFATSRISAMANSI